MNEYQQIGLFINPMLNPSEIQTIKQICDQINEKGQCYANIPSLGYPSSYPNNLDIMITFGGDGTILSMFRTMPNVQCPILGVNLGNLGFMTRTHINELVKSLNKKHEIEKRIALNVKLNEIDHTVINEITFTRKIGLNAIDINIYLDDYFMNRITGDGVIIATPNGSSAYSLSAGGPLIYPTLDVITITPICAHALSTRPIIIPSSSDIKIEVLDVDKTSMYIDAEQQDCCDIVHIRKRSPDTKWIVFDDKDYYDILRKKLNWKGSHRK